VGRTLLAVVMLVASHWCQSTGQSTTSRGPASDRIQNHFAAAQLAEQRDDYAAAEREYQAVLIEAPGFAEAHMNLGLIYQLQDRAQSAGHLVVVGNCPGNVGGHCSRNRHPEACDQPAT
jgi:Tfp pilus assembly protein PilF